MNFINLKNNIITSYSLIPYTWNHKKEVIKLEKQFTGKNTLRIIFHDCDKLIGYILFPFLTLYQHQTIHKFLNKHHHYNKIEKQSETTIKEIILDWESARYTKPDKPYSCRDYCLKFNPHCFPYFEKYMNKWGI